MLNAKPIDNVRIREALEAVSYTHLDVYKRQGTYAPTNTYVYIEYSSSQRIRYRPLDRSGYLLSAASAAQRTIIDYFAMQAVLAVCSEGPSSFISLFPKLVMILHSGRAKKACSVKRN